MAESAPEITLSEIESRKIGKLVERKRESLGSFDIAPVGDSGFLLQSQEQKPMAGNDWVLFDYDDTLAAYAEAKEDRMKLYIQYVIDTISPEIPNEIAKKLLKSTDQFSRWETKQGEGRHYHVSAHMSALTWATEYLRDHMNEDVSEIASTIETKLYNIKKQLTDNTKPEKNDPFYFKNNKLILRTKRPWSRKIENIFQKTVFNPPLYEESIEAAKKIGKLKSSIHRFNVGIFTYGEPYYQLEKVLNLMEKHPTLPISQIWLTRIPKGKFIQDLLETKTVQQTELDYIPPELEDYPGESLSPPSGYPLSQTPHTLVMFDDDPKQLSNILASNDYLKEKSGAKFVVVRSTRAKTKAQHHDWKISSTYGEIDFTSQKHLSTDVANIFRINRLLTMSKNYPSNHPKIIAEKNYLEKMGFNIQQLNNEPKNSTQS